MSINYIKNKKKNNNCKRKLKKANIMMIKMVKLIKMNNQNKMIKIKHPIKKRLIVNTKRFNKSKILHINNNPKRKS